VLLVSESIVGDDPNSRLTPVSNEPDAHERTADEYRALLDRAGLELEEVIEMNASRGLLVARKRK
jgi:hypothetical protein